MNDKYNVTFSAFFKMALLVLPGMITFVVTLIPSYFGRNCLILSLFLTLCMAFAYIMYIDSQELLRHFLFAILSLS